MEVLTLPFRHVVIEGLLPAEYAQLALEHFPSDDSGVWKFSENRHTQAKAILGGDKYQILAPRVRPVFDYLSSAPVLLTLAEIFGISGLMPDPYYAEAGYHRIGHGGYLDAHADFSHHDLTGLERRLNLILYLNKDWPSEWEGELILFDADCNPIKRYAPLYNRAVIFETHETSYHGHPIPVQCPRHTYRKSIAMYYYTLPRPERVKRRAFFPQDPTFVHEAKP